jgi:predicted secreted hydrolase
VSEVTFVYCEKMDKKEFRVLIKNCFSEKITVEGKAWLDKHYSDSAPGKSTVKKWFAKFVDARKKLLPTKTSKSSQNNFE